MIKIDVIHSVIAINTVQDNSVKVKKLITILLEKIGLG